MSEHELRSITIIRANMSVAGRELLLRLLDLKAPAAQSGLFIAGFRTRVFVVAALSPPLLCPPRILQTKLTCPLRTKDGGTLGIVLDTCTYMLALSKDRESLDRTRRVSRSRR
jgi:hypothetical protein